MPRKRKELVPTEGLSETTERLKRLVPKTCLDDIVLNEKQKQLIKLIDENDIIVVTGPAGCLTKNQKIKIYNMKSKKQKRNIIYEENNM